MLKLLISTISLVADSGFASISSGHLLQFVPVCMVATSSGSVDVQISHLPTKTSTFGILLPRMSLWPVLQQYLVENDLQQYPYWQEPTPVLIVIIVEYRCIKFKTLCSLNKRLFMPTFPPRISRNRHLGANTKDAERGIGHPLSKCHRHCICCMSRMYRVSHDKVNCHCKLVAIRFSRTHLCWGHIQ